MGAPKKMHRPTAILAAIFVIAAQLLNIFSVKYLSQNQPWLSTLNLLSDTLVAVLLAVILFRGKKDTAAGVVFLLTLIPPLLSIVWSFLSILAAFALHYEDGYYFTYSAMAMLSEFVAACFRGLAAGECLSNGRVSAGRSRTLLWLLPVIGFGCAFVSNVFLDISYGESIGSAIWISTVYLIPHWAGPVLMGASLSAREKTE